MVELLPRIVGRCHTYRIITFKGKQASHYSGGLAKIDCARRVAAHMDPDRNRSHSFRDALRDLVRA